MNNVIKQLHDEAVIYTVSLCGQEHTDGPRPFLEVLDEKFANLIIEENINFISKEIDRLCNYQRSLPVWDENRRDDCDLVIDKCFDIIEGLKQHFGIKE